MRRTPYTNRNKSKQHTEYTLYNWYDGKQERQKLVSSDAMCIAAVAKWILINIQTHSKYAYDIMKEKRECITKRVSSKNTFLFHV